MLIGRRSFFALALATVAASVANAQQPSGAAPPVTVIRAARLIDPKSGTVTNNAAIVVDRGRITAVGSNVAVPANARVIDLGNVTGTGATASYTDTPGAGVPRRFYIVYQLN